MEVPTSRLCLPGPARAQKPSEYPANRGCNRGRICGRIPGPICGRNRGLAAVGKIVVAIVVTIVVTIVVAFVVTFVVPFVVVAIVAIVVPFLVEFLVAGTRICAHRKPPQSDTLVPAKAHPATWGSSCSLAGALLFRLNWECRVEGVPSYGTVRECLGRFGKTAQGLENARCDLYLKTSFDYNRNSHLGWQPKGS